MSFQERVRGSPGRLPRVCVVRVAEVAGRETEVQKGRPSYATELVHRKSGLKTHEHLFS